MPFARASLLPALDDPPIVGGEHQSLFAKFRRYLQLQGVEASMPMFYQDDDAAEGYVGEFILPLAQAIRPPLGIVLSAWLDQRSGRAVRLSVGEGEAEASARNHARGGETVCDKEADLLRALEALDAARKFVAASMLVVDIHDAKAEPVCRTLIAADENLDSAREKLDITRKPEGQALPTGVTRIIDWRRLRKS